MCNFAYIEVMGKFKNQDSMRKPKGWPPNVTKKSIIDFKKWSPEPTLKNEADSEKPNE